MRVSSSSPALRSPSRSSLNVSTSSRRLRRAPALCGALRPAPPRRAPKDLANQSGRTRLRKGGWAKRNDRRRPRMQLTVQIKIDAGDPVTVIINECGVATTLHATRTNDEPRLTISAPQRLVPELILLPDTANAAVPSPGPGCATPRLSKQVACFPAATSRAACAVTSQGTPSALMPGPTTAPARTVRTIRTACRSNRRDRSRPRFGSHWRTGSRRGRRCLRHRTAMCSGRPCTLARSHP